MKTDDQIGRANMWSGWGFWDSVGFPKEIPWKFSKYQVWPVLPHHAACFWNFSKNIQNEKIASTGFLFSV